MAEIKTILVIEDDRFIGEMYVRSLRKAGYEVDWVATGTEGLTGASTNNYDLILLDIMLPEEKGTDILETLRGNQDLIPKSRVIVMTNFDQNDEERMAMQTKADAYLIKADITPRRMVEIVQSMTKVE